MNDETTREKLALALQLAPDMPVLWPSSDKIAAALLPVVRKIVAEELRGAAEAEAKHHSVPAANRLRDRAWHIEGGQS